MTTDARSGRAPMINTSHPSPSLVGKLGEYGFGAVLIDCGDFLGRLHAHRTTPTR